MTLATLEPLDGDPELVEQLGEQYVRISATIQAAVDGLRRIRDDEVQITRRFDDVKEASANLGVVFDRAVSRYEVTGTALIDYAEELRAAQTAANRAIDEHASLGDLVVAHDQEVRILLSLPASDDPGIRDERTQRASELTAMIRGLNARRADAVSDYESATAARDLAAETAAARIQTEIDQSELDGRIWGDRWDWLTGKLGDAGGALLGLLTLVVTGLYHVVRDLVRFAIKVLAVVGVVAVVTAFVLVLLTSWVLEGGLFWFVVGLLQDRSMLEAFLATLIPWATDSRLGRALLPILASAERGVPEVTMTGEPRKSVETFEGPGDFLSWLIAIAKANDEQTYGVDGDELDSDNSGMVTIVEVVQNGETIYYVVQPSTQSWELGSPMPNDGSGNYNAVSSDRTVMQQGTLDAMEAYGIPEDAPVVFVGHSQGGTNSYRLASDPEVLEKYDVRGVYAVGSPVGTIEVDGPACVLDIGHSNDPIHMLGRSILPWFRGSTTTTIIVPTDVPLIEAHDNELYQNSVLNLGDGQGRADTCITATGADFPATVVVTQQSYTVTRQPVPEEVASPTPTP